MSITNVVCNRGCCVLKTLPWEGVSSDSETRRRASKSGVVMYDEGRGEILLVQSRGNLWGMPKGTLEEGEHPRDGAIRETYEEVGILLKPHQLGKSFVLGSATYYMVPYSNSGTSTIQSQDRDNDASGIGWVKIPCIYEMLQADKIKLTNHAHRIIKKFNFRI